MGDWTGCFETATPLCKPGTLIAERVKVALVRHYFRGCLCGLDRGNIETFFSINASIISYEQPVCRYNHISSPLYIHSGTSSSAHHEDAIKDLGERIFYYTKKVVVLVDIHGPSLPSSQTNPVCWAKRDPVRSYYILTIHIDFSTP